MVRLTAEVKRGFLNALYLGAKNTATPLQDALNAFLLNSFPSVQSGRLVVSHAGAGKSTVFQIPRIDQYLSQEEVFGLSQELTEVYNDAVVMLANQNPPVSPTDPIVFAAMMLDDRLQDITRVSPDFTTLLIWPR